MLLVVLRTLARVLLPINKELPHVNEVHESGKENADVPELVRREVEIKVPGLPRILRHTLRFLHTTLRLSPTAGRAERTAPRR